MREGFEDLRDVRVVAEALGALKARDPNMRRIVLKLNEGYSGECNAVFRFDDDRAPEGGALSSWVRARLPSLAFEARDMAWDVYRAKLRSMGAVVEAFVEGAEKRSPSAQYRVDPLGRVEVISTHDQVLGGPSGQIFLGCRFPADPAYRPEVQAAGLRVAAILRDRGVLGRFGVDFLSVREGDRWTHYGIEINLRKGGTTHPFLMLQFLTDGRYEPETGTYHTPTGRPCCYRATDNLQAERYRGLTPDDLIDIAVRNGLHFHGGTCEGVVFHLIGALSEFGKVGMVCVAATPERARGLYEETASILDRESNGFGPGELDEGRPGRPEELDHAG